MALNITDNKQKLALFLNYVGSESYDIYDSLYVPGGADTYEQAIELFDGHFTPKVNVSYEVYQFRQMKQNVDETIQQFFIRVKQQAQKCEFDTALEKEIKQQLELATNNNKLRRYIHSELLD